MKWIDIYHYLELAIILLSLIVYQGRVGEKSMDFEKVKRRFKEIYLSPKWSFLFNMI